MNLQIISDHDEEVYCSEMAPSNNDFLLLPGYFKQFAQGDYGSMLYQYIGGSDWSIWYSTYEMSRKVSFKSLADTPTLELHVMLENDFHCTLEGIGEIVMQQQQFNLTYAPYIESRTLFNPGYFQTFDVHVSLSFLQNGAQCYPRLNELISHIDKHAAYRLSQINYFASNQMLMIIQQILHCKYIAPFKQSYIEGKVLELFLLAMDKITDNFSIKPMVLKPYDLERLHEAKDILIKEIDNPMSILELARRIGINDFKLKKGFKQIFGSTIFEYQLEIRMQKAIELLQSDKNISVTEIAFMVGYEGIHAFSNAFKQYFGAPPSSFRNR